MCLEGSKPLRFRADPGTALAIWLRRAGVFSIERDYVIRDRLGNDIQQGDFLLYVTKTEAPSIQFGRVTKMTLKSHTKQEHYEGFNYTMQLHRCNPNGTGINKTNFIYDYATNSGEYVDTGRPDVVTLKVETRQGRYWTNDFEDHRFLKTQPI